MAVARVPAQETCQDPLFLEYQARIQERHTARQRLDGWREFLHLHPQTPCRKRVEQTIERLQGSETLRQESRESRAWEREARGGLLAPGSERFPPYLVLCDPVPRNRVRLTQELVFLSDRTQFKGEVDQPVLTQLLRLEAAPVYNLSLSAELPLIGGTPQGKDFLYGIGNMVLGVRGVYGRNLGQDLPWVIGGGVRWGTGSSGWSGDGVDRLLNAAAYAAPYAYHYFRDHQTDYAVHLESRLGVGRQFFALGIAYHLFSQEQPLTFKVPPDPVIRMFRYDAAWQMEVLPWLVPLVELNGGVSSPLSSDASHLFVSPGLLLRLGHFSAALAVRIPLVAFAGYARLVVSLELGAEL